MLKRVTSIISCFLLLFSVSFTVLAEPFPEGLCINEVMASGKLTAVDGKTVDWIELYNSGKETIDLSGYGISDKELFPYRTTLSGQLPPGAYMVLTPDKGLTFSLDADGERLVLTSPSGQTADEVSYARLPFDASLAKTGEGWQQTWLPTPGQENALLSRDETEGQRYAAAASFGVIVSEVLAANGEFRQSVPRHDWVELYNPGETTVKLDGLFLSTDAGKLQQWPFPRGASLRAGQRALVYCAGEGVSLSGRGTYINEAFTIDKSNGAVILSDGETIIDCVSWEKQHGNVSYGRPTGQGAFRFFNSSTPGLPNPIRGSMLRAEPVLFSAKGGFISDGVSLSLSAGEGCLIHYTLDGSEPTSESAVYTSPIIISDNTVVRALAIREGWIDAPIATQTYLFDDPWPEVPVFSLTGEEGIFFGGKGIFEPENGSIPLESRINLEIFEAEDTPVNQQVSIRLTGGTSQKFLPRAFSLYARPGLGPSTIAYNGFSDRSYSGYSCLTLRHGGTDARRTRLRDAFLSRLAKGYNMMYLASAPAAVYVNGSFWGVFNLRERPNQDSIAQWEGITDKDAIKDITIIKNQGIQVKGSRDELKDLAAFCRTKDLNDPQNLRHVLQFLDVDSLFAHTAFQIISGNADLQNIRYYKIPGGKWKLLLFDLDMAMFNSNPPPIDFYQGNGRSATKLVYGELFISLMQVPAMKDQFLSLIGRILRERFAAPMVLSEFDRWHEAYTPLMRRHAERWDDFSVKSWEKAMDTFRAVLEKRPALVVQYMNRTYKLTEEENDRYFGAFLQYNKKETP